jgi:hypothetical protein
LGQRGRTDSFALFFSVSPLRSAILYLPGSCDAIRDFVDVAFCASRLGSAPGAASADRHDHLLMAADLAAASRASACDAVAGMARREGGDPVARDALEACSILYGAVSVLALRLMRGYAAARAAAAHGSGRDRVRCRAHGLRAGQVPDCRRQP